jgi:acetyl-CoA acetyltransferase
VSASAFIIGVGMLRFGRMLERSVPSLATDALRTTLADAGLEAPSVQAVWFANSGWGNHGGQDCIRAQVALKATPLRGTAMVNVENACAGGSTALHGALLGVSSGAYDVALALGAEKLCQERRLRTFASFLGGLEVAALPELMARARELRERSVAPAHARTPAHARSPHEPRRRAGLGALPRAALDALMIADHYQLDVGALLAGALKDRLHSRGRRGNGGDRSPFMDVYAIGARRHMARHGSTARQLALIAEKNHAHGAENPLAQIQRAMSADEILGDRLVSPPLTRAMCAPLGDGAAAAVVCSAAFARKHGLSRAVRVRASVLLSGSRDSGAGDTPGLAERASRRAYELAELGPDAVHVAEVHDATAFGELSQSEALGFCAEGEGGLLAESGATRLGGRIPLNTSGGLECRGHPIAASGLAQIHELVLQLRGEAGRRQVARARVALAQNGGGFLGEEEAAMTLHVLEGKGA